VGRQVAAGAVAAPLVVPSGEEVHPVEAGEAVGRQVAGGDAYSVYLLQ
jgi:hypothetical protein